MEKDKEFNKGTYYIGDLCYVLSDEERANVFKDVNSAEYRKDDVYMHQTRAGDGVYASSTGDMFYVDSGSIGMCPIGMVSIPGGITLGAIVEFDEPFDVTWTSGFFSFGDKINIYT